MKDYSIHCTNTGLYVFSNVFYTIYRVFRNCLRTLPAIFDIENVDEYCQKIKSVYEEGCDNFLSNSKFESRTSVKS